MTNSFTPGRWNNSSMAMSKKDWAGLWNDELTIVRAKWDGFTGEVVACVWADDDKEEFANARLIAAAPDMYEALKEARALNAYKGEELEALFRNWFDIFAAPALAKVQQ